MREEGRTKTGLSRWAEGANVRARYAHGAMSKTQLMLFNKKRNIRQKISDDDEFTRSPASAEELDVDIPETDAVYAERGTAAAAEVDHKKVRPIQMGEIFRRYVSRRVLA